MRQTGDSLVAALDEEQRLCLNNLHVLVPKDKKANVRYLLGILNSKLLNWYYQSLNPEVGEALAEVKRTNVAALPIRAIDSLQASERKLADAITKLVTKLLAEKRKTVLPVLDGAIRHSNRTPCNLAHYLQKDLTAAVQQEKVIDDVQRTGFVHAIQIDADGRELALSATVADKADGAPHPLAVLRLTFKNDALREFIYALWKQFLAENCRKKKWTTGKNPERIYDLLVNSLEPLVFFQSGTADNLRAIRELMKAVAAEAGSSDLAAIEQEIKKLDSEIDERVYELYSLTPEERAIVEARTK